MNWTALTSRLGRLGLTWDNMGLLYAFRCPTLGNDYVVLVRDHDGDGRAVSISCKNRRTRTFNSSVTAKRVALAVVEMFMEAN